MARIEIWDLDINETVVEHIWEHRVTPEELDTVLDGDYIVVANRGQRVASHILIGLDAHGRCLAAPIVPTDNPSTWRVITAWPCKTGEETILRRHLRLR